MGTVHSMCTVGNPSRVADCERVLYIATAARQELFLANRFDSPIVASRACEPFTAVVRDRLMTTGRYDYARGRHFSWMDVKTGTNDWLI